MFMQLRSTIGFSLLEILAILMILGILAATAIPMYDDFQNQARIMAAKGQIAEVKGRLHNALAGYILSYSGSKPSGYGLVIFLNEKTSPDGCPTDSANEGDFEFRCVGQATTKVVLIDVIRVKDVILNPTVTGSFAFGD